MLILEAANIKKYYSDRLIIGFEELKVYSGDKIGIVGQNGSGKTTLMNLLSKEVTPDEGFIKHYGEISYIRQFSEERLEAEQKVLKEFNLSHKAHQEVFSGGEKTRIKIANAFSNEKLLLFADEPTSNLDYKGIELLRKKLSAIDSFVIISHDRLLLDSLCNKILEVRDGKLNHAQRAKSHPLRVVIGVERKSMIGVEPVVTGVSPLLGASNGNHDVASWGASVNFGISVDASPKGRN